MFPAEDSAHEVVNTSGEERGRARWLGWKRHSIKPDSILRTSKLRLTYLRVSSSSHFLSLFSVRLISTDVGLTRECFS